MRQIVGNGAEDRLARGWGVEGLQHFGELNVHFLEFSYGMAQSSEAVRVVDRCFVCVGLVYLSVVVGVVVVDERGQELSSAGMCKGVGGRILEVAVEGFPLLKEGGGRCHILLCFRNEGVVVIVVDWEPNSGGVGFGILAGRVFS